jgi:plasmid stabilization system protein ParE
MKRLVFAPSAREDLKTIALVIAEDNPSRAEGFALGDFRSTGNV